MANFEFRGKNYEIDGRGFLADPDKWDRDFAIGMAPTLGIVDGLTDDHWHVILYIRKMFAETGKCPMVHQIGKHCSLKLHDLKRLFPTGYMRGACHLAGLTYLQEGLEVILPGGIARRVSVPAPERTFVVDIRGFLVNTTDWDEEYAAFKAHEIKMPELNEVHWQIIKFLRESYAKNGKIPTIYETCESAGIDLEDLGALFPDGYYRGAVKIAGLRAVV